MVKMESKEACMYLYLGENYLKLVEIPRGALLTSLKFKEEMNNKNNKTNYENLFF